MTDGNEQESIEWWTGSNGNLFADHNGFRYCLARLEDGEYSVARNGQFLGRVPSIADGKLYVRREG